MPINFDIQQFSLWDKLKDKQAPLSFDLEVTARCNNNCRHCYINLPASDKKAKDKELNLAEIESIAGQAAEMGAVWCLITGGEPLLREDFVEIYLMLKRKGLLVSVFTNATLIKSEHIDLFKKYPPHDIEATAYGASRQTYERVSRKFGSYTAFIRGLDGLFDAGVKVHLKAMALRSNLLEMEAIAAFCRSRTKNDYRFDPQLHLRYDGDSLRNAEIQAERLTPEEIVVLERADVERFGAMQLHCDTLINDVFTHNGCDHLFHCRAGIGSFSVGYDGTFRLCSALWAPGTTVNLRQTSLRTAWETLTPRVRDMRSNNPEYLNTCLKCPIINLCLHCAAVTHLETGAMDGATPYFCQVAHSRAAALQEHTSA
ncbi:MAG: radical SAM protein [Anaerolineaceae bacterium]|nr:radical SAM protein [Anaerolineaceae bacterium]